MSTPSLLEPHQPVDRPRAIAVDAPPRNPLVGMIVFLAVFAAVGAVYVALARHDMAGTTQLGVLAVACAAFSAMLALPERRRVGSD